MVGHSKWSKVKHIKGPLDVKRGAAFSKLVKEITVAARPGGGDLSGNPRLRSVVKTARAQNMPKDNIETATDNKNRTAADLRIIFSKNHGSLAAAGSVLYMFHKKGLLTVPRPLSDQDGTLEITLDAGDIPARLDS